nr:ABC transporter permease [Bryobacter sp.]
MPEAAFEQVEVRESGRQLEVRCRVRNTGDSALRREDGTAAGWQLFDPETGLFIQEGAWKAIPDLKPGGAYDLSLPVELPVQPGRYRLFVSLRQENGGWFYERNQPFLLIEAEVEEGLVRLRRSLVTTLGRLRREGFPRLLQRALTLPFLTTWRNRALIASLVRRDILSRYRGSLGGRVWTFLSPLLLMTTYYFVFGIVLQTRFGADPSRSGFVLYFLAAMLPWLAFSESLARSPLTLVENRNLIKKLVFPVEILPVNITLAS